MGPENESALMNGTLYLDGEPIAIGTMDLDAPEPKGNYRKLRCRAFADLSLEMKFTFKPPKRWRCRSRKRFIKLMMSEGINRNYAEWLADFVRAFMPYGEAWRQYVLFNTRIIKVG